MNLLWNFFATDKTEWAKTLQYVGTLERAVVGFIWCISFSIVDSDLLPDIYALRFLTTQVNFIELLTSLQVLNCYEKISHAISVKIDKSRRMRHGKAFVLNGFLNAAFFGVIYD